MALSEEHLNFIDRAVKLVEEHGLWKICKALFVVGAFAYIMYNGMNVGSVITDAMNKYETEHTEAHDAALDIRRNIQPDINDILVKTRLKLNADRAFIVELHNGTNSSSGLPFTFGNITYEKVNDVKGIEYIAEDYNDITLSRFTLPLYMMNNPTWSGTIEELYEIDDKLAKRMSSNGVTYAALSRLHGVETELGYFGVTYCNGSEPADRRVLIETLMESTQKLSTLLDINAYYERGDAELN